MKQGNLLINWTNTKPTTKESIRRHSHSILFNVICFSRRMRVSIGFFSVLLVSQTLMQIYNNWIELKMNSIKYLSVEDIWQRELKRESNNRTLQKWKAQIDKWVPHYRGCKMELRIITPNDTGVSNHYFDGTHSRIKLMLRIHCLPHKQSNQTSQLSNCICFFVCSNYFLVWCVCAGFLANHQSMFEHNIHWRQTSLSSAQQDHLILHFISIDYGMGVPIEICIHSFTCSAH